MRPPDSYHVIDDIPDAGIFCAARESDSRKYLFLPRALGRDSSRDLQLAPLEPSLTIRALPSTAADSAPTGNLLYCVNEKYVDPAGLETHMALGQERWEYFPLLMESISKYGAFMTTNGVILTNFSDAADPCTARKGDVTINTGITVPASMEREVDDLWAKHETFMRETHQFGAAPGDDLERPRITQFTIVKAKELRDPLDPAKGFTGNVQYSMQETYVTPEGVKGHFATLPKAHPDVSERLIAILTDPQYQKFGDVGQGKVITSMDKNAAFVSNIVGGLKKVLASVFKKN